MQVNQTIISPNFHGGKTVRTDIDTEDGKVWVLSTQKRFNKQVSTDAQLNRKECGMLVWTHGDPQYKFKSEKIRATENALLNQHHHALERLKLIILHDELIQFYEAIDEEKWCINHTCINEKRCAVGHLIFKDKKEYFKLALIELAIKSFHLPTINDADVAEILGVDLNKETPKKNIIGFLKAYKKEYYECDNFLRG